MKQKVFLSLFLLFLIISIPALAVETESKTEQSHFTLEVTGNLINLQADRASFKDILKELEKKSGIKVKIFEGVEDKKVSLNIKSLPIFAIHSLLNKMELKNFAVVYDSEISSDVIYVLSEGQDINEVIKGKAVIRPAKFADGKNINRIKGRKITSVTEGKDNIPIRYIKDELLLKFHLGVTEQEIEEVLRKHNLVLINNESLSKIGYIKARIPDGRDVIEVIKAVRKEYKVKTPEPNYIAGILTITDPLYESQWYVPDTNFDKAWGELKNNNEVKIAVIDSGVNGDHPDLKGKILEGYDFINNDADATDDHGHGTFVSGIIAATSNNIGIKGLYDYAKILPVKVIDATGIGTYEDTARGIIYAADNGAKVLNLSIGGYGFSFMLQDAVDYALEKGCVVVAAGGNDGIESPVYPAGYPDVIGVSALGYSGQIWTDSNRGGHIDVSAPGVNILSTGLNGDYVYASGTSASTAMVSAFSGMLFSERNNLSRSFIERLIMQSAKDLGDKGKDIIYGHGGIDALSALKQKVNPFHDLAITKLSFDPEILNFGESISTLVTIENLGTFVERDIELKFTVNEAIIDNIHSISEIYPAEKQTYIFKFIPHVNGKYTIQAELTDKKDEDISNNIKRINLSFSDFDERLVIQFAVSTHRWVTKRAIEFLNGKVDTVIYNEIYSFMSELLEGVEHEDCNTNWFIIGPNNCGANSYDSTDRWLNHFYRPTDEQGYSGTGGNGVNSFQWGGVNNPNNSYDWYNAIQAYNSGQKSDAYFALGHVLHLIEDASLPEHTQLEAHVDLNPLNVQGYEVTVKNRTFSDDSADLPEPLPSDTIIQYGDIETYIDTLANLSYYRNRFQGTLNANPVDGTLGGGNMQDIYPSLHYQSGLLVDDAWVIDDVCFLDTVKWDPAGGVNTSDDWWETRLFKNNDEELTDFYYMEKSNCVIPTEDKGTTVGGNWYPNGTSDIYQPNTTGLTLADLMIEDLVPLAIRHVAGAIMLFWNETHPPSITTHAYSTSPSTNIYITFSEEMDVSTFTNSNITVSGSSSGIHPSTFSNFDTQTYELTIDPTTNFSYGESVTVTIGTGVQDLPGNGLAAPYTFSFNIKSTPGPDPTSISVTENLNPSTTTAYSSVTVSGTATYNTGDLVSAGTATITAGGNTWTASVSNGNYSRDITAPGSSGYVYVYVSDGSLTSPTAQQYLTITGDQGGSGYTLYRTTTARDAQSSDPYDPIYETEFFRRSDTKALAWTHLTNLYQPVRVRFMFYEPDGDQFFTYTSGWTDDPSDSGYEYWYWWKFNAYIYINGDAASYNPGRWSCKIEIDDGSGWDYKTTEYFTIGYEFTEHRMAQDVQTSEPYMPINETNIFYQTDTQALTWANADNVVESFDVRWEYFEPNGDLYTSFTYTTDDPGADYYYDNYRFWGWIDIDGYLAANKTGDWRVEVFIIDAGGTYENIYTDYFQILENPAIDPIVSVSSTPNLPVEGDTINLDVSTSDNTLLKKVILYWNDGSLQSEIYDNIFSNTHSASRSIGSYSYGSAIEYYAIAYDTSGNSSESVHRSFIVGDSDINGPVISGVSVTVEDDDGDGILEDDEQVRVTATITDSSGISSVEIEIDDVPYSVQNIGDTYYIVAGPFTTGTHSYEIVATDADTPASTSRNSDLFDVTATPDIEVTPTSLSFDLAGSGGSPAHSSDSNSNGAGASIITSDKKTNIYKTLDNGKLKKKYANDRIIVKLKNKLSEASAMSFMQRKSIGVSSMDEKIGRLKVKKINPVLKRERIQKRGTKDKFGVNRIYIFEVEEGIDISEAVEDLKLDPNVEYAEPDYVGTGSLTPNDTLFSSQWALHNTGQSGGSIDADIDATEGWDIETGDSGIIAAVLDSGIDASHEDFTGKVIAGYDFANSDSDPSDDHGHGTHVAGILAANANNNRGIAGVSWNARLMPVKVLDSNNSGWYSWFIDGIIYAVDNGAKVINMSIYGYDYSQAFQDAVNYAYSNGVLVVVCMGNDNNETPKYPAAFENVMAVGATDHNDVRVDLSPWGSDYGNHIDIVAPGLNILSSVPNNGYEYWSGTSMATPQVSGVAALLLSVNSDYTPDVIETLIEMTSDDLVGDPLEDAPGWDKYYGWGRLNAHQAVENASYLVSGLYKVVTVENIGAGELLISSITSPESPFSIGVENCTGQILSTNEMCTILVGFNPSSYGPFSSSFNILSNDPDEPEVTINLDGTGLSTEIECFDGIDNDNDGDADCADSDCEGQICNDGLYCSEGETCQSGVCTGGSSRDCTAMDDQCNDGVCDENSDSCIQDPAQYEGQSCDDNLYCNEGEACQSGVCSGGNARDCSDGVNCTDDSCNESIDSCENLANDANCLDDGLFCNGVEFCDQINDCYSQGDPCVAGSTCNEDSDICEAQEADLSITISDNPDPVEIGSNLTYTITVLNNGPGDATGVTVTDTLSMYLLYVSATPSQGSCSESSGTVTCDLGTLNNGVSATVDIIVTPTLGTSRSNTVSVTSDINDPDTGNNNATEITTLTPHTPVDRYVLEGGNDGTNCTDPLLPCATIQHAVDVAYSGDIIKVAQGTYENVSIEKTIDGLTIQGGWGSDFIGPRSEDPSLTIVDGNGGGNVFYVHSTEYHSPRTHVSNLILEGLTITNGSTGIYIDHDVWGSPLTIKNNIITGNTNYGIRSSNVDTNITLSIIENLIANNQGDGIWARSFDSALSATLTDNVIRDNGSRGIYMESDGWYSTGIMQNNVVTGNQNSGIYAYGDRGTLSLSLINNTITGNSASDGGGIYAYADYGNVLMDITNTIIWGNDATGSGNDIYIIESTYSLASATINASYSDIGDVVIDPINTEGDEYNDLGSNINANPLLVGEYQLTPDSLCINAGDNSAVSGLTTDIEGDPRIINNTVDIGADEYANNWISIKAGGYHTVAIRQDGTLWTWGNNWFGQIGDGTTDDRYSPVQIGTDNVWASIAAGVYHIVAIKNDDTLWAWGMNNHGQLGYTTTDICNTNPCSQVPQQLGSASDWESVAAGGDFTLAIKTDGTLWSWGWNRNGKLGLGDTADRYTPEQIGSETDWRYIAAGINHAFAIKTDGTLWSWGNNDNGQLGLGVGDSERHVPDQVGIETEWMSVAAGYNHTAALRSGGTLWTWGANNNGQLGSDYPNGRNSPVQVGTDDRWITIAVGSDHSVALKTDGTLWTWGFNSNGQLGYTAPDMCGTDPCSQAPLQLGSASDWISASAGWAHASALKSDGTLMGWGLNAYGQIGDGTTTDNPIPVAANEPPVAVIDGPYFNTEGQPIALDGSLSSDSNGSIDFYEWDMENDGVFDYSSATPSHVYAQQGTYDIMLRVTDNLGSTAQVLTSAVISDTSPTADYSALPTSTAPGSLIDFTNNSTGYDQPLTCEWDFDNDGNVDSTDISPSYAYASSGMYTVELIVTDSDGSTNALTRTNYIDVCYEPVKTTAGPAYHLTIQNAYNLAAIVDSVQIQNTTFNEYPVFGIDKTITIDAGYDCDFLNNTTGTTTVIGDMTINSGTIIIQTGTLVLQ